MTITRRREKGVALIAVLLVTALLAAIAAAFTVNTRTQVIIARNTVEGARARALADAGVNWAVYLIGDPAAAPPADGTPVAHAFEGGVVTVSVQDEAGKVDLNRANEALLRGLFIAAGLERAEAEGLADAVMDYRDADGLKRLHGAEDADYRAAGRDLGAKDARFESVDELRRVLGMTEELFAVVAGALTVHGKRRVTEAVATPLARAAMSGDGALGDRASPLAEAAAGASGERVARSLSATPFVPEGAAAPGRGPRATGRNAYTIRAEALTDTGAVFVRQAIIRPAVMGERPYTVLEWRQGRRADEDAAAP